MTLARSAALLLIALPFLPALGCASDEPAAATSADPTAKESALALLGVACDAALEDVYAAAPPPGAFTDAMRGDVVRCAYDRFIPPEEMTAHFAALHLKEASISTGVHKIRLSYWTTRGPGEPKLTSAAIYLPAEPVAPSSPLLVLAHGSVGVADKCAPSRDDPKGYTDDFRSLIYTVAGDGWAAIMPDNPGLGTEGATAWGYAVDEGHALLDATRAARKLLKPAVLDDKNLILGHSIGGQAALSAHAYLDGYGAEGQVVATVAYVPMFFSNATWGALISSIGASYLNPTLLSLSMQYFYGHLAAYEGEERALDAFIEEKRSDIKDFLEGGYWYDVTHENGPQRIGIPTAADGFTPEYTTEVGNCAFTGNCTTPLAKRWKERWAADRPAPVTSVPIVIWQGVKDDFFAPGYQQCGIDRLTAQGADLTVCGDPEGDHSSVIADTATWVRGYLREKLLGEAAPSPCTGLRELLPDLTCDVPIPNATDPSEP